MSEAELVELEMLLKKMAHILKGAPRSVKDRVNDMGVAVQWVRESR
jgi:hypothetical protein